VASLTSAPPCSLNPTTTSVFSCIYTGCHDACMMSYTPTRYLLLPGTWWTPAPAGCWWGLCPPYVPPARCPVSPGTHLSTCPRPGHQPHTILHHLASNMPDAAGESTVACLLMLLVPRICPSLDACLF
jgi:hypothetical protein